MNERPFRGNRRDPGAQGTPDLPVEARGPLSRVPSVRLASSTMDEGMLSSLARIDECLRYRKHIGDAETLNRIEYLFKTRFGGIGL